MIERFQKLRDIANAYLNARKKFIDAVKELENEDSTELKGNDNLIGRIGEFIALQYLHENNRKPTKVISLSNKGFDLRCDDETIRVSVKTITYENKSGQTTKLHEDWDEFILILINEDLEVEKIGHITKTKFQEAVLAKKIAPVPYVRRNMLREDGLFYKHGTIKIGTEVSKYLGH